MNCEICAEELTAFLDGELEESRRREMEGHLKGCPACHGELESLRKAALLVESNLEEIEPRPEIWDKVQAGIIAAQDRPRRAGLLQLLVAHRWKVATASLAVCLAMTAGVWGIRSHQQSERMLHQYMSEYVQMRDRQEIAARAANLHRVKFTAGDSIEVHSEYDENPFVDVKFEEIDNPFRSEAR